MRVRIAQCLCSAKDRHAILAMAVHDENTTNEDAIGMLQAAIVEALAGRGEAIGLPKGMRDYCGICGIDSSEWVYEVGQSKQFDSWEQAQEACKALQEAQQATKAMMDMLGLSFDAYLAKKKAENN